MSAELAPGIIGPVYKDRYVKRLMSEERVKRRRTLGTIREQFDMHHDRFPSDSRMVMHKLVGERSVAHAVVMSRKVEGSGSGRFDYLWYERLVLGDDGRDPANPVVRFMQRSFSVARHHNGFRHEQHDGILHVSPELFGLQTATHSELPNAKLPKKSLLASPEDQLQRMAFIPGISIGLADTEIMTAPAKLHELLGILISLEHTEPDPEPMRETLEARAMLLLA